MLFLARTQTQSLTGLCPFQPCIRLHKPRQRLLQVISTYCELIKSRLLASSFLMPFHVIRPSWEQITKSFHQSSKGPFWKVSGLERFVFSSWKWQAEASAEKSLFEVGWWSRHVLREGRTFQSIALCVSARVSERVQGSPNWAILAKRAEMDLSLVLTRRLVLC